MVAGGDLIKAGLDGAGPASADRISGTKFAWGWSASTMDGNPASLVVSTPGVHTFHLWMREDDLRVDRILLRTSASVTPPPGTGPAESTQDEPPPPPPPPPNEVEVTNTPLPVVVQHPLGERIVLVENLPLATNNFTPSVDVTRYKTLFVHVLIFGTESVVANPQFRIDPGDPYANLITESREVFSIFLNSFDNAQVQEVPVAGNDFRVRFGNGPVATTATVLIYGIPREP